jgi:hypothetical protein
MGRKGFERISQREFARRLDVSNEAVSQAVKNGKISKGWDKGAGKIIYEKAMEEWGNLFVKIDAESEQATADVVKRLQSVPGPQITKPRAKDPDDSQQSAFDELEEYETLALSARAPFAEALRVEKVAKAKQEIIKLKKETGELVNKEEVYRQLFGYGQSVRNAILAIPDRIIDEVLAAPNRALAHQVLTSGIHEALTKLTDVETLSFQDQQNEN